MLFAADRVSPSKELKGLRVAPVAHPHLPVAVTVAEGLRSAAERYQGLSHAKNTWLLRIGSLHTSKKPVTGLVVHSIALDEMKRVCSSSPAAGCAI